MSGLALAVDVLAFDELALLAAVRDERGAFAPSLGDEEAMADPVHYGLLQVRRDADAAIFFTGPSAEVQDYERTERLPSPVEPGWRASGFRADLFAGIVIGVGV